MREILGGFWEIFWAIFPGKQPEILVENTLSIYAIFGQNQPICENWSKSGPFFIVVCGQNFHYFSICDFPSKSGYMQILVKTCYMRFMGKIRKDANNEKRSQFLSSDLRLQGLGGRWNQTPRVEGVEQIDTTSTTHIIDNPIKKVKVYAISCQNHTCLISTPKIIIM